MKRRRFPWALAALGVALLLTLPAGWPRVLAVPLELPLLAALLLLLPRRVARWAAPVVALLLFVLILLTAAAAAVWGGFGRPLNLAIDLRLLPMLGEWLVGTLPAWQTVLLTVGGGLGLLALGWLTLAAASGLARHGGARRGLALGLVGLAVAGFLAQRAAVDRVWPWRLASWDGGLEVWRQADRYLATARATAALRALLAVEPLADLPPRLRLQRLKDVDVLVVFVESYGRSAVERPPMAAAIGPRLRTFDEALDAVGLHAASGWLTSPTVGGQSWLAHGSLLSGLWLDSQIAYDLLLQSERRGLSHLFKDLGHRTVMVMPAIVRAWPEAAWFDYEASYFADDLGYRGPPYDWVTMPDQFTLSRFQQRELGPSRSERRPVFAEIALISSHAPWTPIAEPLDDWNRIGDGEVFERWVENGEPPSSVWANPDKIRAYFTRSLDYTLAVLHRFAAAFVDERTLLVIVGDHQPAGLVTGPDAGRDVPWHVISADPDLLAPLLDWGLTVGMRPGPDARTHRMDAVRDRLVRGFSAEDAPLVALP